MRPNSRGLFLTLVTFATASFVLAEDWPRYRGAGGAGVSPDTLGGVTWPDNGPRIVWKKPTPLGFSSFAISNGRAMTLVSRENEAGELSQVCVALDASTGDELWSHAMSPSKFDGGGGAGAPGNRGGDGPRSTPTIDGDRVYLYDAQMKLACLSAADGSLVWERDIVADFAGRNIQWQNATCPVIDGGTVFVAGGGEGQSMIALDKLTGEVVWTTGDQRYTHATPTVATIHGVRQVIFFMQSGMVSLDPLDGTELWRTKFPYSTSTAASPVVDGDLVYCSAGYGVGSALFRISEDMQAELVWRKPNELMNHWSTPVVRDGHLYGLFEFKKYGKAPLQCVELATGEIKWKQRGYGPGNCILVGDKIVALSDSGDLAIVAATPDEYRELARAEVLAGKCWSTPAYSDGRVYIRSTEEGACVSLE